LIGTGSSNNAFSTSSVVLGGIDNDAGISGNAAIIYSTVLGGDTNQATGGM
jgi:hypothetical protein